MGEYLYQLGEVQDNHDGCPILLAGDLFHKPDNPAELINWLLQRMPPKVYGIPGQHDLPMHNYEDIKKSSYWTMVESGKIYHLEPGRNELPGGLSVYGFPWGCPVKSADIDDQTRTRIAVAHTYVWWKDHKFKGAPKESNILKMDARLNGYSSVVFGDNHKGFLTMAEAELDPWIINCGAFIRRRMDEIHYKPQIGLIHAAGNIDIHELDTQADVFIDIDEALEVVEHAIEAADLLEELAKAGGKVIEFAQAVAEFCEKNKIAKPIRSVLSQAMKDES